MPRGSRNDALGTGVSWRAYGVLLGISIAVFLFWSGPLWSQPRGASHVARFAVSYLAMIPLLAGVLWVWRRFTWTRLLTGLGTLWSIKLVATSALYLALARGDATALQPPAAHAEREAAPASGYLPAAGRFPAGTLRGRIGGGRLDAAIVYVADPAPGRALEAEGATTIEIAAGRFDRALYLIRSTDRLHASNRDGRLHTFHLHHGLEALANQPLPPTGRPQELTPPEPGEYQLRSDADPALEAWLVVVDHPYAVTAGDGTFELAEVPAGPVRLVAIAVQHGSVLREERLLELAPGATVDVDLTPAVVAASLQP